MYKIIVAVLMFINIVVGTFVFINLIVAVAANTLVRLRSSLVYNCMAVNPLPRLSLSAASMCCLTSSVNLLITVNFRWSA